MMLNTFNLKYKLLVIFAHIVCPAVLYTDWHDLSGAFKLLRIRNCFTYWGAVHPPNN